ncbi:hypothetical protein TIFTF001_051529 [Ficus carica]|uniref:AAA+ ATPase At3g28540-like C-terminal domain-containing protein n=3 Tax=Ficus carica TaxID=3494 RepID=A0AA88CQ46_FICCA|nr:hypothetical protein TIFTF001_051529 [Ficus carica]
MDKHIELSYCCFEAFKVLAKNYLDVKSHDLFATIERLLGETNMIPADVAENLIPKSDDEDANVCLNNLVEALEKTKEKARKISVEDAWLGAKRVEDHQKLEVSEEGKELEKVSEQTSTIEDSLP